MKYRVEGLSIWKWLLINIVAIVFGCVLFWSAIGAVAGLFIVPPVGESAEYERVLEKLLTPEELVALKEGRLGRKEIRAIFSQRNKKGEMLFLLKMQAQQVNLLIILPIMNIIVFGVIGFIVGLFRLFRYVALIPAVLLYITFPMLTSDLFALAPQRLITVLLSVVAQFIFIYIFAWFGRALRTR